MLLSVIIPTRNRARYVADLLDSLAAQEPVAFDWEVLVVDNASTDATAEVALEKAQTLPIRIRHVYEPNLGLHRGRHRGAKEAEGTFVGYLDDDMTLAPTWIQGVDLAAQGRAEAVVGRILPRWEAPPPDWVAGLADQGVDGYYGLLNRGTESKPIDPMLVFGGNCFWPKQLLLDLGGFHPDGVPSDLLRYRGDGETGLMLKFKQAGLRSIYDPRATAFHIVSRERLTVEYICQRAYRQGISDSFTQIRVEHGLSEALSTPTGLRHYIDRLRQRGPGEAAKAVIGKIGGKLGRSTPLPYAEIRAQIAQAHRAGWEFHQNEVKNDPQLLEYVLRQTYLEDSIP